MKYLVISAIAGAAAMFSGAVMADQPDTLAKIKASKTITIGTRESSALSFTLGNGKFVGFHTEMAERIAEDLKKSLGLPSLDVKYQPVTSQNRIPLVTNGTVDLECGSTTNTTARQKDVSFAMTTYLEDTRIMVRVGSGIKSIKDLNGKNVGATTGTTTVANLRKLERAAGLEFTEHFGKDHADTMLLLESGRVEAFVMDRSVLAANRAKSKNPKAYEILDEVITIEPIACMLPKGDTAFQKAVNTSIQRQIADGSLKVLYNKWFTQPIAPTNTSLDLPLSAATAEAWANPNDKPMEAYNAK